MGRRVPVFFLTGGIEHVEERNLVVDHALLPIRIFDSLPNFARRYISQGQIIKTGGGGGVGLAPREQVKESDSTYWVISETSRQVNLGMSEGRGLGLQQTRTYSSTWQHGQR